MNDVVDAPVDALTKPDRPIPSGAITRTACAFIACTFAASGIAVAFTLGIATGAVSIGITALAAAYSLMLKCTLLIGNASVGICVGATLVFGGLVGGSVNSAIAVGAVMVTLYLTAQEVLFNIEDEDGDRRGRLATTATRLGTVRAIRLYRALTLVFLVASHSPLFLVETKVGYLPAIMACAVLPMLVILVLLHRPNDVSIGRAVLVSRITWFVGIVPLLLLR